VFSTRQSIALTCLAIGCGESPGQPVVETVSAKLWMEEQTIGPAPIGDGAEGDAFGIALAVVGDTALIGAPSDDVAGLENQGSVYVFERVGTGWTSPDKLTASDAAEGASFGTSVSMDGDTALIGASGGEAAYVFTRAAGTWTQQAKVVATDGTTGISNFGVSVALQGNTAVVGASLSSAAYVFEATGADWTQVAKLTAGVPFDGFGVAVALSDDTALVGAPRSDAGAGVTYVFIRSGGAWIQQTKLTPGDAEPDDSFGNAVAFADGTALIGAWTDDVGANQDQGSAYVFTTDGTSWTEQAKLVASDGGAQDQLGVCLALSGDDVVLGAAWHDVLTNEDQGAAYVFARSGTTWSEQATLVANDGELADLFGGGIALVGDVVLIGASYDDVAPNPDQGSVREFSRNGTSWSEVSLIATASGAALAHFGESVSLAGNLAVVGSPGGPGPGLDALGPRGSATVLERAGNEWNRTATLSASDGAAQDGFGSSISASGNTVLVGTPYADAGAAYVFVEQSGSWVEQAKLVASGPNELGAFGSRVALSGDTALVASNEAVHLFVRTGETWSSDGELDVLNDGETLADLAIALDGDTALVGVSGVWSELESLPGVAYVFVRSAGNWSLQQTLSIDAGDDSQDFASTVALSGDTALIANTYAEAVYVFRRTGATWEQEAKFVPNRIAGHFGASLAISGEYAIVGAPWSGILGGKAYLFQRFGSDWYPQEEPDAPAGDDFDLYGQSVAISFDMAMIGAPSETGTGVYGNPEEGRVHFWRRNCGQIENDPTCDGIDDDCDGIVDEDSHCDGTGGSSGAGGQGGGEPEASSDGVEEDEGCGCEAPGRPRGLEWMAVALASALAITSRRASPSLRRALPTRSGRASGNADLR
jgi:hypothetical protein